MAQLFSIHAVEHEEGEMEQKEKGEIILDSQQWKIHELDSLNKLLFEFRDLFEEPYSLPPHRYYDHSIVLKP